MRIDLHIHEKRHSADSRLDIETAVLDAKRRGLDGICVTDHDQLGLRTYAKELSRAHGLLVLVGVEIYTLDGDLLCYGIDHLPEQRLTAQETIDFVREQGGVCIAAHPYRKNNRGLGDKLFEVSGLHGIEGYNGRTGQVENERAVKAARQLGLPITGGSDAHTPGETGRVVTEFDASIHSEADFLHAVRKGRVCPFWLDGPVEEELEREAWSA